MNNRTLISVIIPSYNRADTVGETIESILAQFETAKKYGKNCTGISSFKRLCSQHR